MFYLRSRRIRKDVGKMIENLFVRFLRLYFIFGRNCFISEKILGSAVLCYTPTIRFSVLILAIDKIGNTKVSLHIQMRDNSLESRIAAFAIIAKSLQIFWKKHLMSRDRFIDIFILMRHKSFIATGIEGFSIEEIFGFRKFGNIFYPYIQFPKSLYKSVQKARRINSETVQKLLFFGQRAIIYYNPKSFSVDCRSIGLIGIR